MISQFLCQAQQEVAVTFNFSDVISRYYARGIAFLPKLLIAIIVLIAFVIIQKIVEKLVRMGMDSLKWETAVQQLILSVVKSTVIGFGVIIAFGRMGLDVASLDVGR